MLKVFVSTRATQGEQPDDFCFVPANELVDQLTFRGLAEVDVGRRV